jgi:hypothetical protein
MIYLHVPFEQKDDAKSMGAKWDPQKKLWYAQDESFKNLIEKYSALVPKQSRITKTDTNSEPQKPLVLIGENRRFGGNELYVDILPKGSNISIKRLLSDNDFSRLRNLLVKRVAYRCECCSEECISSEKKYLEVCECFSYNFNTRVQKLEKFTALCKKCYTTTRLADKGVALAHLMDVNGLDKEDAKQHIYEAFDSWKARSNIKWSVDLSLVTNSGLQIDSPKKKDDKQTGHKDEQNIAKSTCNSKITINKIGGNKKTSSSNMNASSSSSSSSSNSKQQSKDTKKITINKITSNKKEQCMFEDD